MKINDVSGQVVDAAICVHSELGPGLLESAYQACLAHELRSRGLRVDVQMPLPVVYRGREVDLGYRVDLCVENAVLVELKAVRQVLRVHEAQLLSYLKLGGYSVGLLVNFHSLRLKDGITRLIVDR